MLSPEGLATGIADFGTMAREHLLLIDANEESAAVMELALRQSGYSVARTTDLKAALELIDHAAPSLLVFDLSSCEDPQASIRLLASPQSGAPALPCIFLCESDTLDEVEESYRPRSKDCLQKPVYLRELVSRVNLLLESRRRALWSKRDGGRSRFSGELSDLGVVDLLQTIDICKKSGVVTLKTRAGDGEIWFKDGALIDASFGKLQADAAVYRMIRLEEGAFGVQFKSVRRAKAMSATTQAVLLEGLSQLDKWHRYCEQLPSLDKPLLANPADLKKDERASSLGVDALALLRRFRSKKSIREVLFESRRNDLELLEILSELYFSGALMQASRAGQDSAPDDDAPTRFRPTDSMGARPLSMTKPMLHEGLAPPPRPKAVTQRLTSGAGPVASALPLPSPEPSQPPRATSKASSRSGHPRIAKTMMIPHASAEEQNSEPVRGSSRGSGRPVSATLVYHESDQDSASAPFTKVGPAVSLAQKIDPAPEPIPMAANSEPVKAPEQVVSKPEPLKVVQDPEPCKAEQDAEPVEAEQEPESESDSLKAEQDPELLETEQDFEPEPKEEKRTPAGKMRREQMLAELEATHAEAVSKSASLQLDEPASSREPEDRRMWTDVSSDQDLGSMSMMGAVIGCVLTVGFVLGQPFLGAYFGHRHDGGGHDGDPPHAPEAAHLAPLLAGEHDQEADHGEAEACEAPEDLSASYALDLRAQHGSEPDPHDGHQASEAQAKPEPEVSADHGKPEPSTDHGEVEHHEGHASDEKHADQEAHKPTSEPDAAHKQPPAHTLH